MARFRRQQGAPLQKVSVEEVNKLLAETAGEENLPDEAERQIALKRRTPIERLALAEQCARMYCDGQSAAKIKEYFAANHGLKAWQTQNLIREVESELKEESKHRSGLNKAASERRILGHIVKAAKRGNFGAVAKLEETLARVQGTLEPDKVEIGASARLTDAILHVLGQQDQKGVRTLVAEGVEIVDTTAPTPLLNAAKKTTAKKGKGRKKRREKPAQGENTTP